MGTPPKGWQPWVQIGHRDGSAALGQPVRAVWSPNNPNHLDLFVTDADGQIMSTWWEHPKGWQPWIQISNGTAARGQPVLAAGVAATPTILICS